MAAWDGVALWGQQLTDQKVLKEKPGDGMSSGSLIKFQHISGNLQGSAHAQGILEKALSAHLWLALRFCTSRKWRLRVTGYSGGSDGEESARSAGGLAGSLGWADLVEEGTATHSSILAWRIPWTEEAGGYSPWGHKESDTTEWPTQGRVMNWLAKPGNCPSTCTEALGKGWEIHQLKAFKDISVQLILNH